MRANLTKILLLAASINMAYANLTEIRDTDPDLEFSDRDKNADVAREKAKAFDDLPFSHHDEDENDVIPSGNASDAEKTKKDDFAKTAAAQAKIARFVRERNARKAAERAATSNNEFDLGDQDGGQGLAHKNAIKNGRGFDDAEKGSNTGEDDRAAIFADMPDLSDYTSNSRFKNDWQQKDRHKDSYKIHEEAANDAYAERIKLAREQDEIDRAEASTKLQSLFRGSKTRKELADKKAQEADRRNAEADRIAREEAEADRAAVFADMPDFDGYESHSKFADSDFHSADREKAYHTHKETVENERLAREQDDANRTAASATKLQNAFRSFKAKQILSDKKTEKVRQAKDAMLAELEQYNEEEKQLKRTIRLKNSEIVNLSNRLMKTRQELKDTERNASYANEDRQKKLYKKEISEKTSYIVSLDKEASKVKILLETAQNELTDLTEKKARIEEQLANAAS